MTLFLKQVEFNMKFFTILIALREYLGCAASEKGAVEPGDPQMRNNAASSCPGQFLAAGRLLWTCVPGNARSHNQGGAGRVDHCAWLVAFEGCAAGGHVEEGLVGQEKELEK